MFLSKIFIFCFNPGKAPTWLKNYWQGHKVSTQTNCCKLVFYWISELPNFYFLHYIAKLFTFKVNNYKDDILNTMTNLSSKDSCKYRKTCLKWPLKKKTKKIAFKIDYCLMQVKNIAAILSTLLSYHLSLRPLFYLYLSRHFRQVLLYTFLLIFLSALKE